jgi:hypothetical protein
MGFDYYRSPRNLGIPRNMNLGMLQAVDAGYDAIILLNSDTIVPRNLVPSLIGPLMADPSVASTTAWSNDVSIYSLTNSDPDALRARPDLVNWVSDQLADEFEGKPVVIPAGVGFCMALSTAAIDKIGLMDPVFGRGYSEEVDWCLRSHGEGMTSNLVHTCFVFHAGSGINRAEGLIGQGDHIVHAHQAIIDQRYPHYRSQLVDFTTSGTMGDLREQALRRIVCAAASERGYVLEVSRLNNSPSDANRVRFVIEPEGRYPMLCASYEGFQAAFPLGIEGSLPTVRALVGRDPSSIRILSRGQASERLMEQLTDEETDRVYRPRYRETVF